MNLKEFANGRLKSVEVLENIADREALYSQVYGACSFYAELGEKQAEEAKEVWQDFSWKYFEIIHKN